MLPISSSSAILLPVVHGHSHTAQVIVGHRYCVTMIYGTNWDKHTAIYKNENKYTCTA